MELSRQDGQGPAINKMGKAGDIERNRAEDTRQECFVTLDMNTQ